MVNQLTTSALLIGVSLQKYEDIVEQAEEAQISEKYNKVCTLRQRLSEIILNYTIEIIRKLLNERVVDVRYLLSVVNSSIRSLLTENYEVQNYIHELSRIVNLRDLLQLVVHELEHIVSRPHEVVIGKTTQKNKITLLELLEHCYCSRTQYEYTALIDYLMLFLSKFYIVYSLVSEYYDYIENVTELLSRIVLFEIVVTALFDISFNALENINKIRTVLRCLKELYDCLDHEHAKLLDGYVLKQHV